MLYTFFSSTKRKERNISMNFNFYVLLTELFFMDGNFLEKFINIVLEKDISTKFFICH